MTDTALTVPQGAATDIAPSPQVETPSIPTGKPRDTQGRFAPASKPEETTDPAVPSAEADSPPEKAEPTVETPPALDETPKDREARRKSAKERIDEITAQKHAALRDADTYRQRTAVLERQIAELQNSDSLDMTTDVRRAVKTESLEQSKEAAQMAFQAAQAAMVQEFNAKVNIARESIPNIDTALPAFYNIPLSNAACDVVASSEKAAEIAFYLGQNPQEGHRIAALPVYRQTAEIARLENRLSVPKPKNISAAPKPATTLGGSASPKADDLSSMPMDQFHALMTKAR